jgi:hypothetical protein
VSKQIKFVDDGDGSWLEVFGARTDHVRITAADDAERVVSVDLDSETLFDFIATLREKLDALQSIRVG